MTDLERAISAVIRECVAVRRREEVVVVCNPATQGIGRRFRREAEAAGGEAVLVVMAERKSHAAEPPDTVAAAMVRADVILAPTVQSLSHTAARRAATDGGARAATLPGVSEEMLARLMSADLKELRRRSHELAEILTGGNEARITCSNGSDLTLSLEGRTAIPDAGELAEPGAFGNLPCGEGFIAPVEDRGGGRLVVDGTIASIGVPSSPVELELEDGRLVSATGSEGEQLMQLLGKHGQEAMHVAELGVGTNEKAILSPEVLEAEKILGTVHVAFGASAGIGGRIQVPVHLDCVVTRPNLAVDGKPVVRDGDLLA
jgi:aminopeptidase